MDIEVNFEPYTNNAFTYLNLIYDVCGSKRERLIVDDRTIAHVFFNGPDMLIDFLDFFDLKKLLDSSGSLSCESPFFYVLPNNKKSI